MALKIEKRPAPRPRRTVLYGVHGIGKSTFGASSPNPVFIQTEDGIADIDCDRFPLCTSFDQFTDQLYSLFTEEHEYKTLVIDTADWLEALIHKQVAEKAGVKSIDDIGYGKGFSQAVDVWRTVFEGLDQLVTRGVGVLLLAHCQVTKFQDPAGDSYDRYSPKLHAKSSAVLQEWADEVLFGSYTVLTKSVDEGFNKKRTVPVGSKGRVLYASEAPSRLAKNRLAMPPEIGFSWSEYASYFRKDNNQ